jgi:hypothetical protein
MSPLLEAAEAEGVPGAGEVPVGPDPSQGSPVQVVFEDHIVVKDGKTARVMEERVVTRSSPERDGAASPATPRFLGAWAA